MMKFVSVYSGAGGLDLGFIAAGFEPVWANDLDPAAVATYNATIDGDHAVAGPIEAAMRNALHGQPRFPKRGGADVVIGGPPCQGFSIAGRMNPSDPRSRHVMTFLDVVEALEPRAFVMENVKALLVSDRWELLREDLEERAEHLGYSTTWLLVDAADYGVPQRRERMFLVGLPRGSLPTPRPRPAAARTVGDVLRGLPQPGDPGNDLLCAARITPAKKPVLRRSPYAGMLFNGMGRPLNLDAPSMTLPASMGGNRTPIVDQDELAAGRSAWIKWYHQKLWKHRDEDDLGPYIVRQVPSRLRRLTVQEAAALQTFPMGMRFMGPRLSQYRQIGNAVPPLLARAVAESLHVALAGSSMQVA